MVVHSIPTSDASISTGGIGNGFGPIQVNFVVNAPNTSFAPPPIPTAANGDVSPAGIGSNFAGIDTTSTNTVAAFYGGVRGNLTQPINVGQLAFFRADGAINSSITASSGFNSSQRVYVQATNAITGSVTLVNGVLARVRAFSGNISGAISAPTILVVESAQADVTGNITATSSIGTVSAPFGAIGTATSTISAPVINIIDANGSLRGTFSATGTASDAASSLQRFRGTTFSGNLNVSRVQKLATGQAWTNAIDLAGTSTGTVIIRDASASPLSFAGGVTSGSLSFGTLSAPATITGSLGAPLSITSTTSTGSLTITGSVPVGRTISISGAHSGTISVGSPSVPQLLGQMILNAAGGTAGTTWWAGPISIDGITLSTTQSQPNQAPTYDRSAASLGGGSIGVAPFRMHAADCTPPSGAGLALASTPSPTSPIFIRLYGPLTFTGVPVTIERSTLNNPTWVDVTSCFTIDLDPASPNRLRITPIDAAIQNGWKYRVKPVLGAASNALRCALVTGNPPVTDFTYTFCVGTEEAADINGDGDVNTADLTQFLGSFGQGPQCNLRGDFNTDNSTNTADLTYFLGRFGTGGYGACAPPASEFVMTGPGEESAVAAARHAAAEATAVQAPTPPGPVVAALGFTSLEAYDAWVSTLTEQQATAHIIELFEIIKGLGLE